MLTIVLYYAAKHGWDGGFVIFYVGFYGWAGLFLYLFFVASLLPLSPPEMVAPPVQRTYLDGEPLSEKESKSRLGSIRPLGIT